MPHATPEIPLFDPMLVYYQRARLRHYRDEALNGPPITEQERKAWDEFARRVCSTGGPEDNPADEEQPTKEEWEEYERRQEAEPTPDQTQEDK